MGYEDLEIRIAKNGTVYVKADNISEERILSLRRFLEEEIGPVQDVVIQSIPEWDRKGGLSDINIVPKNIVINSLD